MFSYAIRTIGIRIMDSLNEEGLFLQWTDTSLKARIGNNFNTWILKDGIWMRSCTCNAPGAHCVHDYVSCILVNTVFLREKWIDTIGRPTNETTTPQPTKTPAPPPKPSPEAAKPHPVSFPSPRESFFTQTSPNQPVLPIVNPEPPADATPAIQKPKAKIEAEVDLHSVTKLIVIRFYQRTLDMRELLTLQQFLKLSVEVRRPNTQYDWSPEDISFITWCSAKLRTMQAAKSLPFKAQAFTLERNIFDTWLERWKDNPTRFIERDSQKPYRPSSLRHPTGISIELVSDNDCINAVFRYLFQNGTSATLLDIANIIMTAPDKEDIRNALKAFKPPFDMGPFWDGNGKVRIRRERLQSELPRLLNGHLELVTGKHVNHLTGSNRDITVKLDVQNGFFTIQAELDGKPFDLDGYTAPPAEVKYYHGKINIRQGKIAEMDTLRNTVRKLSPPAFLNDGICSLYETPQNAMILKIFWDGLPESLNKTASPAIAGLFIDQKKSATIHLIADNHQKAFTTFNLQWSFGDGATCSTEDLKYCGSRQSPYFKSSDGKWLSIDPEQAREALQKLREIGLANIADETYLSAHSGEIVRKLTNAFETEMSPETAAFAKRLAEQPPPTLPPLPKHFTSILRKYQTEGVEFLMDRVVCGVGAILADDMGLGKTLQILAMLEAFRDEARRCGGTFKTLVVCPASVVPVWLGQAARFCPSLSIAAITGNAAQRQRILKKSQAEIFVTHYPLVRQDAELLKSQKFDFLILDEAQAIKNPTAQLTAAVNSLDAVHAIALTGTPLENSANDLWSIMNRLNPGFLGDRDDFQGRYMQRQGGLTALSRKIAPLLIRRSKQLVAPELPPKTEEIISVELPPEQRTFYDAQLALGQAALKEHGTGSILGTLTRLREACCHPQLVTKRENPIGSAKLEMLLEKLMDLQASGHSSLVFSQFTSMLDLIAPKLDELNIPYRIITGDTPVAKRSQLVADFDADENPSVFLLSLKAAGTGLTLTKADYVFLFDPWWNPAVERQAIDRTHRIGQDKPVFAYKFVAKDTVEEKVQILIEQKKELFDEIMDGATAQSAPSRLTIDDLRSLIE